MKTFFLTVMTLMGTFVLNAQEAPAKKEIKERQLVGLGVRSAIFHMSELPTRVMPANRLLINVDPIKNLRLEAHFGLYRNTREELVYSSPGVYSKLKVTDKSLLFGGGIFAVYPVDNIRFIGGLRYSLNNYSSDDIQFGSSPSPYVVSNKGAINIFSGVIGGEYFFAKWFSLGAEFSIIQMSDKYTPFDKTLPSVTANTMISESSLLFRFYPF